jgi:C4-dicarboxylate transporter/malic acid transport protein
MIDDIKKSSKNEIATQYILRWFSPRWFVFVMGTGALANAYQLIAGKPEGHLHNMAVLFLSLAIAVFCTAVVFLIVRFVVSTDCVLKEWRHSSLIQFYSAISIAAAVCATGLFNIPLAFIPKVLANNLAVVFWWISFVVGLFFIFFTPSKITIGNHAQPMRALGFWFLPPVGLFVLVFAGNFWALQMTNQDHVKSILFANTLILGAAIPLTTMLYTIILFRALFYNFPRKDVAPNFMIGVAPVGVCIIAINTILPVLEKSAVSIIATGTLAPFISVASLLLWGFGLWWLIYALIIIVFYFLKQGIPFTLGYWAFIFPPAAYIIATLILAKSLSLPVLKDFAVILAVVFTLWWIVNSILTIRGMINRTIFDVSPTFKGDIPYL